MSVTVERVSPMPRAVRITRKKFLEDQQGRTFADVLKRIKKALDPNNILNRDIGIFKESE